MDNQINVIELCSTQTILASAVHRFGPIDLSGMQPGGYCSLQVALTGDGTAKFEYELSNDDSNYLTPSSASDIDTAHTVGDGPDSDGKDMFSFSPMVSKSMQIKVTETGGVDSIVVTMHLALQ